MKKQQGFLTGLLLSTLFFSCGKMGTPINLSERDKAAYDLTFPNLKTGLAEKGIDIQKTEIFLRAFKQEEELEVWVREQGIDTFGYFKSYPFCESSGSLGPKRKEGDLQTPEGGYHIDRFNPKSSFHLSLGINYPNPSEIILGDSEKPGSDIFIHGACVTVGCIPITNGGIKELYTLADIARKQGQEKIIVHILPFRMSDENMKKWSKKHPEHQGFWQSIRPLYLHFETNKEPPSFSINDKGEYIF